MNEILKVTVEALIVVIITVVPVITKYLISLINAKSAQAQQTTQNATEKKLLSSIEGLVTDSVQYVSQTFVDTLKANGTFDAENQKIALNLAVSNIEETLSEEAKEFIMSNYGDMTSWIVTKVESCIKTNK